MKFPLLEDEILDGLASYLRGQEFYGQGRQKILPEVVLEKDGDNRRLPFPGIILKLLGESTRDWHSFSSTVLDSDVTNLTASAGGAVIDVPVKYNDFSFQMAVEVLTRTKEEAKYLNYCLLNALLPEAEESELLLFIDKTPVSVSAVSINSYTEKEAQTQRRRTIHIFEVEFPEIHYRRIRGGLDVRVTDLAGDPADTDMIVETEL